VRSRKDIGRPDQFAPARVAVYFGEPGKTVPIRTSVARGGPYRLHRMRGLHDWLPPQRETRSTELSLARREAGRAHRGRHRGDLVRELPGGGYRIDATTGAGWFGKRKRSFTTRNVIFAGACFGTVPLLLKLKTSPEGLPRLSEPHRRLRAHELGGADRRDHSR